MFPPHFYHKRNFIVIKAHQKQLEKIATGKNLPWKQTIKQKRNVIHSVEKRFSFSPSLQWQTPGQNLAREWGKWIESKDAGPEDSVRRWFIEKNYYSFSKFAYPMPSWMCRKEPCGHYTQVSLRITIIMLVTNQLISSFVKTFACKYAPFETRFFSLVTHMWTHEITSAKTVDERSCKTTG